MNTKAVRKRAIALLIAMAAVVAACSNGQGGAGDAGQPGPNAETGGTQGESGGTQSESGGTQGDAPEPEENPDPLGKYDPPIRLTTVGNSYQAGKYSGGTNRTENNNWQKGYRDELGIEVEYLWTAEFGQPYDDKMNLTIASGDLPDMMLVNATQLKTLVEEGLVEDLTDVYEKYISPIARRNLELDGRNLDSGKFQGRLMGLPQVGYGPETNAQLLFVRTDWMKRYGLQPPKTIDDVVHIAETFVKNDAGGENTIGLGIESGLFPTFFGIQGFLNGFHASPRIWIEDDSGKLVYGDIQPEFKAGLAKLREMYEAGLLDKEFGVKDGGKVTEALVQGKIGMFYGINWNPLYPLQSVRDNDPNADWAAFPLPSIDGNPARPAVQNTTGPYYVVRKGYEHPEALVKLFNFTYEKAYGEDSKTEYQKYFGGDVDIRPEADSKHNAAVMGGSTTKQIDGLKALKEAMQTKDTSDLSPEFKGYYDSIQKFLAGDQKEWQWYNWLLAENNPNDVLYGAYKDNLTTDAFYGAPTDAMITKDATLDKLENEFITKVIYGEASVDEFDQFVADWLNLGGEQMTQEVNEWAANR